VHSQYLAYTESLKADPNFLFTALNRLLQIEASHANINFGFWLFQAVEQILKTHYEAFRPEQHTQVQECIKLLLNSRIDLLTLHFSFLNKFALVYVKVLQVDFPNAWPNAFDLMLEMASQDEARSRVFLTILKIFHEEVVEYRGSMNQEQAIASTRLKDAFKEVVVPRASQIWAVLLHSKITGIASMTLEVLAAYTEWVPLETALEFLPTIQAYLGVPACQIAALQCIRSLVDKGMNSEKKVALVEKLQVFPFLQSIDFAVLDSALSDVPKTLASLVDVLGGAMLPAKDEQRLQMSLDFALKCLDYNDPEVSKMVLNFLSNYIHSLRIKGQVSPPQPLTEQERYNIGNLCMIIMRRSQLPDTFEHVGPENSDEEDQFYKYRGELSSLFKRLLTVEHTQDPVLDYLISLFQQVLSSPDSFTVEQIEAPLFLLFEFGESVTELAALMATENKFSILFATILESRLKTVTHKIILKKYFEVCIRYAVYFTTANHGAAVINILEPLLNTMFSQEPDLSKHAIYMLYRLTIKCSGAIIPYASITLDRISAKLSSGSCDDESKGNLYKALGTILSSKQMNQELQASCLRSIAQTLLGSVSEASVRSIGEVLSGFNSSSSPEVQQVLVEISQGLYPIVQAGIPTKEMFESCLVVVKRVLSCSSNPEIARAFLQEFVKQLNIDTVEGVMIYITQIVAQLDNAGAVASSDIVGGLIDFIMNNVPRPTESISDISRTAIGIRRSMVKMMDTMVSKSLEFSSPDKFPVVIEYLLGIAENIIEHSSPAIALEVLRKLIELFTRLAPTSPLSQQLVLRTNQACEGIIRHPNLHPRNPETHKLALEIASVHRTSLEYARATGSDGNYLGYLATSIPITHQADYFQLLTAAEEGATEAEQRVWRSQVMSKMRHVLMQLIEGFKAPQQNKLT